MQDKYLVHSVDKSELNLAIKDYLPFVQQGFKPYYFEKHKKAREEHPLIAAYFPLLDLLFSHYLSEPIFQDIETLYAQYLSKIEERSQNIILSDEVKHKIITEEFSLYKSYIENKLKQHEMEKDINVWSIPADDVEFFNKSLFKQIRLRLKRQRIISSLRDVYRGVSIYLNNRPIALEESDFDPSILSKDVINAYDKRNFNILLGKFKKTFEEAGVKDESIINFLSEYLKQDCLSTSGPTYHEAMLSSGFGDHQISTFQNSECQTHSFKITYDKNTKDMSVVSEKIFQNIGDVQNLNINHEKIQIRSTTKFKIKKVGESEDPYSYKNIQLEIDSCNLEIFDDKMRSIFLESNSKNIAEKIRRKISLLTYDQQIIKYQFDQFSQEVVDNNNQNNLNPNVVFLLAWESASFTKNLLSRSNYKYKAFFSRDIEKVQQDVQYLANKHLYNEEIKEKCNHFINNIQLFHDTAKHQKSKFNLDVKKIEKFLATSPEEASIMMFSLKDEKIIKKIINNTKITNHLSSDVLTHLAMQSKTIAKSLLEQSAWKRFKISFNTILRLDKNEILPCDRFTSDQLTLILKEHPDLWDSVFAKNSPSIFDHWFGHKRDYRQLFTYKNLQSLIDPKTSSRRSYRKAAHQIISDKNLYEKASFTFAQRIQLLKDDRRIMLSDLAHPEEDNPIVQENTNMFLGNSPTTSLWQDVHSLLTNDELYSLYVNKFGQVSDSPETLKTVIIDLWADLVPIVKSASVEDLRKVVSSEIRFNKWPSLLKWIILDKFPKLHETVRSLIQKHHFDSIKKMNPVLDEKYAELYSSQEEYRLLMKFVEKFDIVKKALIEIVAQNGLSIVNFFIPGKNNPYHNRFSDIQYHSLLKAFLNHPGIYDQLLKADFFWDEIKEDTFLAKSILKIACKKNNKELFLKIYNLVPLHDRKILLERNRKITNFLLHQLSYDSQFFETCTKLLPIESTEFSIILNKANPSDILCFLVNQDKLVVSKGCETKLIFLKLKNIHEILNRILSNCSSAELSLLFSKCPEVLTKIADLDLYKTHSKKIQEAYLQGRLCYKPSSLINFMNFDFQFENVVRQMNHLQPKLKEEKLAHYFNVTSGQDLLRYLIKHSDTINLSGIKDIDSYKMLLSYIISNPELMQKILNDLNNNSVALLGLFFDKIFKLYRSRKDETLSNVLKGFINTTLHMCIKNQTGRDKLLKSKKFIYYANYFGDEELLLPVIATGSQIDLADWKIGIDRVSKLNGFAEYLPRLLEIPKFHFLLFHLWSEGKLTKDNIKLAKITPVVLEKIIKNRNFIPRDFAKLLKYQYSQTVLSPINCKLRTLLLDSLELREELLIKCTGLSHEYLTSILLMELKVDPTSVIVDAILSKDTLEYIFSFNPMFIEILSTLTIPDKYKTTVNQVILKHFFEREEFKDLICSNEKLFGYMVTLIKEHEELKGFYLSFLGETLKRQKISPIIEKSIISEPEVTAITVIENLNGNSLCDFIVNLRTDKQFIMADHLLNNPLTYTKILSPETLSEKKVEFFVFLFGYLKRVDSENELQLANQKFIIMNKDKFLLNNLHDVPTDKLIELYVKDGIKVDDVTNYIFRDTIESDENLTRLFLYATDDKMVDLLSAGHHLIDKFIEKVIGNEPVSRILRQRIKESIPHQNNALLKFLGNLSNQKLLILMESDSEIRTRLLQQIQLDKTFFNGEQDTRKEFIIENLIKYENTQLLVEYINICQKNNKKNFVAYHFIEVLQSESQSEYAQFATQHILMSDIQAENNLVEVLIKSLPVQTWMNAWVNDKSIENKFFLQMVRSGFLKKLLENIDDVVLFLGHSSHIITFYLYLLESEPKLGINLQTFFIDNQEESEKILQNLSPGELALIIEKEKDMEQKPLSNIILQEKNKSVSEKMLCATDLINDSYVGSSSFRKLVRDPNSSHSFYKSFRFVPGPKFKNYEIKFKSDRKVEFGHLCAFIYNLYVRFNYRTRTGRKLKEVYEDFWTSLNYFLILDQEGNLTFYQKGRSPSEQETLPLRHCVFYYEAFAYLYFYEEGDYSHQGAGNLQDALVERPKLRENLLKTIQFNKEGKIIFAKFDEEKDIDVPLPPSYKDAVLYALCLSPNLSSDLKKYPGLEDEFLNSIDIDDGQNVKFKNGGVQVPDIYADTITKILLSNLSTQDPKRLCLISKLPDIYEMIKENQILRNNLINSVNYYQSGAIKFRSNQEPIPPCFKKVLKIALHFTKSINPDQILKNSPTLKDLFFTNSPSTKRYKAEQHQQKMSMFIGHSEAKMIEVKN